MNVIWIVSDTYRRDHMGAYGNPIIHTPSLDALAASGTRFDRHYIGAFPTMPTRADHATGRWTMSFMQWGPLGQDVTTLAQLLAGAGLHTAAVVDTPFYQRNGMNYDRGFRTFFNIEGQLYGGEGRDIVSWWRGEADTHVARTMTRAGEWLERHYQEDFFLYVDTWDPHEPWNAPSYYTELYMPDFDGQPSHPAYGCWRDLPGMTEEMVTTAHATYMGEVTLVDTWVGHLLRKVENMGLAEKTAIIFTSDHGFYFGEHDGLFGKLTVAKRPDGTLSIAAPNAAVQRALGRRRGPEDARGWGHSPLYEEVAGIPLLIHVPGIDAGSSQTLSSAIDVMPTVLDIFEQPIPDWVDGRSLLPAMKGAADAGREFVVSAQPFANPGAQTRAVDDQSRPVAAAQVTTITTDKWSFLYSADAGMSELFHLESDPGQLTDVLAGHTDIATELHGHLARFMEETNLPPHLTEPRLELRL